jgi:GAF domain-containing protein
MRSWSVTARGLAAVQVQGRNWIVALGRGLEELGKAEGLARLACEVLPNGTVIARDIATGTGYIVQGVGVVEEEAAAPVQDEDQVPFAPPDGDHDAADAAPARGDDATDAEPIFELPAEAVTERIADDILVRVNAAETTLLASQLALSAAQGESGAESGAVILEERGYLRFVAVGGPASRKLVGVRLPMGTGVAGFAMEKQRTVVLNDAHEDDRHCGEVDALTGYVTREIAVVPVVAGERVLGVLEVMNLPPGQRFTEAQTVRFRDIADALARRLAR